MKKKGQTRRPLFAHGGMRGAWAGSVGWCRERGAMVVAGGGDTRVSIWIVEMGLVVGRAGSAGN